MKRLFLLLFLSLIPGLAAAQWTDGGLDQPGNTQGNGDMISVGNTLLFWNGTQGILRSTDNGATWTDVDPSDNNNQNGFVAKFAATYGRIWAARSYGTGQGMLYVSTDDGLTWQPDTVGSQPHALGWGGYAVISDMYAWAGHLFIKWDAPDAYDIRPIGGTWSRPSFLASHDPHSVASIGDTLFVISDKLHYTTDFGATWKTAASNNFHPGTMLQADGNRLYMMASEAFNQPNHLFFSEDRGENWIKIDASYATGRQGALGLTNASAYFIKGSNFYLGTLPMTFNGSRPNVFRSTDAGMTWFVDTTGLGVPYYSSVGSFNYHSDGQIWVIPGLDNIYKQKLDNGGGGGSTLAGTAKLLAPVSGSLLQDSVVKFIWSRIIGATAYQFQISTDPFFGTIMLNDSAVVDTFKTVTSLNAGKTYYWRVRGIAPDRVRPKGGIVQKLSNWSSGYFTISKDGKGWQNMGVSGIYDFEIHNDAIYLATEDGIKMSSDEGASWTLLPSGGIEDLTVRFIRSAENKLYVSGYHASSSLGMFVYTTNNGETWIHDTVGLTNGDFIENFEYWAGHVVARRFNEVYMKALTDTEWKLVPGFTGVRFAAYDYTLFSDAYQKTDTYGSSWVAFNGPRTGPDGQEGLYAYGDKLYAITQEDNVGDTLSLFVSSDKGESWSEIPLGSFAAPNDGFGSQLYASYFLVEGDKMWISVEYGSDLDVVYRSDDAGSSWRIDTAGAWEQFKGAHFNRMIYHDGTVWAVSGGPEMGLGTLYRQRVEDEIVIGLDQPELISPDNGSEVEATNATLMWSALAGATRYHVQVSTSQDMSSPQFDLDNVPDLVYTTSALSLNTPYYWRVRGVNDENVGPWSNIWKFTLVEPSSVDRDVANDRIAIYPNPALDHITIQTEEGVRSATIVDLTGRTLQTFGFDGSEIRSISVGHLPSGTYTLVIETITGEHFVKRVVVQ